MVEQGNLLYSDHLPDNAPTPDRLREYEIEDVNPKWIQDILGDWEYRRSPREISFRAFDKSSEAFACIRFTPKFVHIYSLSESAVEPPDPEIQLVGRGSIRFSSQRTSNQNLFVIITHDGESVVDLVNEGSYFKVQTFYTDNADPTISKIPFVNPIPPKK